jgi:hypothetical protein
MALQSRHRLTRGLQRQPVLKVTTLYETLADGVRAKALMNSIQSRFGAEMQVQAEFWRFDWLRERSLCSTALGAARKSAMVIISVGGANHLPPVVQSCIAEWSQFKEAGAYALVLLRPKDHARSSKLRPLCESLQRVADAKGVDFFYESFDPVPAHAPSAIVAPLVPEMARSPHGSPTTRWVQQQLRHSNTVRHSIATTTLESSAHSSLFASNY